MPPNEMLRLRECARVQVSSGSMKRDFTRRRSDPPCLEVPPPHSTPSWSRGRYRDYQFSVLSALECRISMGPRRRGL